MTDPLRAALETMVDEVREATRILSDGYVITQEGQAAVIDRIHLAVAAFANVSRRLHPHRRPPRRPRRRYPTGYRCVLGRRGGQRLVKREWLYYVCGSKVGAESTPPDAAEYVLAWFRERHSGRGHALTDAPTARRARRRLEAEPAP